MAVLFDSVFFVEVFIMYLTFDSWKIIERMHAVLGHATKNNKDQDHDDLGLETSDTKVCHWK